MSYFLSFIILSRKKVGFVGLISLLFLLYLQGCSPIITSHGTEKFEQKPSAHEPPGEHLAYSKFRQEVTAHIGNSFVFEDSEAQGKTKVPQFVIKESFFAASGELCCLVEFGTSEEALFCRKSNGKIIRVRQFK